jgi:predicted amidohydrolase
MQSIRAAAVQFNHAPGDKAANMNTIRTFLQRAADEEVELLVFPEMCLTGYWHLRNVPRATLEELSEAVPEGPASRELVALAREHEITVGAGLIERGDDGNLYNTYVVAMPDGRTAHHRKIHCFLNEHMSSGDSYTVFDDPSGNRLGLLICYDNNLIENARITALKGAEILLAPHQTGGCDSSSPGAMGLIDPELWHNRHENPEAIEAEFRGPKGRGWLMRWLPSRAHDNGMYLLFANGVGYDDGEVRTGNAMIIDPYGQVLEETWKAADDMVVADLDADVLPDSSGRRWMQARRPELYEPLTRPVGNERNTRTVRFEKVSERAKE